MDLKTIRGELAKLSAIVSGWNDPRQISALERDAALEKLRALYDAVRFADAPAVPEQEPSFTAPSSQSQEPEMPEVAPMPIDLGEVLSLDAMPSVLPEEPPVEEPESEIIPASEPEQPEQVEVAAAPIEASNPTDEPKPAAENVVAEKPQPIAPTLFELSEDTMRHRHKQRVIMSLYDTTPAPAPEPTPQAEPEKDPFEEVTLSAEVVEAVATPEPALKPVPEPAVESTHDEVADESFESGDVAPVVTDSDEPDPTPDPTGTSDMERPAAGAVLGDVINPHIQTLGDTIVPSGNKVGDVRRSDRLDDLRDAIGLNDKFLLIRDLFEGDAAAYDAAIATLNGFDDLDDCMIYIAENYAWNANSDGAKFLMELLERKFE